MATTGVRAGGKHSGINKAFSAGGVLGKGDSITTCVGEVNFSDKKQVMAVLDRYQEEWKDLDYEMDCTITTDGKIWISRGADGYVDVDVENLAGAYSYHNHPKNLTKYSFSGEDIGVFLDDGYHHCKCSDHLYMYSIERTAKTVLPKTDNVYDTIQSEFNETVLSVRMNGQIIPGFNPDVDGYHYATIILADKYGFKYTRKEK